MNKMTYTFEDIARYAEEEMTAAEKLAFEDALSKDAELQKQFAAYKEVESSLQQHWTNDAQRHQLKGTMQQLRSEFFAAGASQAGSSLKAVDVTAETAISQAADPTPAQTAPVKIVSINKYLRVAMAVAAVLVIGLFVWQPWQPALYEKYSATQMVAQTERGSHVDSVMNEATTAFNKQEYVTATVLLAEVVSKEPDNSFARFYFGVSLMRTDKIIQARAAFSKLFQGESTFKYEAAFYEALTYLHKSDKDIASAKEWLQKIPADASIYNKAQELLKKL